MVSILILNIVAFLFTLGVTFSTGIIVAYLKALGAAEFIISVSAAAVYIGRGTSSMLLNKISKIIPFKKLFVITFLGSAFSVILFMLPQNPLFVAILRIVQGFFSGFHLVLTNIYAMSLGSKFLTKFKNLSTVTICISIGGFLGSVISGKIASIYSPHISFYTGISILVFGAFVCLFLKDIKDNENQTKKSINSNQLSNKEKSIIGFALFSYCVFTFFTIGIPLFILKIGGSYKEIGYSAGFSILASAIVVGFAPRIKKRFSYKSIMSVDYILIILSLFFIFYLRNIYVTYIFNSLLVGIVAMEKNLWYAILQGISKNYNRSLGILRGYVDYLATSLFLIYGFVIQTFGLYKVVIAPGLVTAIMLYSILFMKNFKFLSHHKTIYIRSISKYKGVLHKSNA